MGLRRRLASRRQHEAVERRLALQQQRDLRLDRLDRGVAKAQLGAGGSGHAEVGADIEQHALHTAQEALRRAARLHRRAQHAERGVGLVHRAVRLDAGGILADACAVAEAGQTEIAAAGDDAVDAYAHAAVSSGSTVCSTEKPSNCGGPR